MKKIVIVLFSLFLTQAFFAQDNEPGWLRGNWKGTGFQTNNNSTWAVELSFQYPDKILRVKYPSLNCSGDWKMINDEGKHIEFVEMITEGKQNCIDGSKIVISKIDDEHIYVSWFSKYIKGIDAYAVLSRTNPEWLNGQWAGNGYQTNNGHVWSVEFSYNAASGTALIKYPSLNCSGNWVLTKNNGYQMVFEEVITQGKQNCIDGSKIVINKIDDNYIGISWFSKYIQGVDAYAALKKK